MTTGLLLGLTPALLANGAIGRYLFTLPARTTFAFLFAAGLLVGLVVGLLLGLWIAIGLLRATDRAVAQYQRRAVACVLEASSGMHTFVHQIVQHTHRRIHALRAELRHLQEDHR